jgi:hypothetical protein
MEGTSRRRQPALSLQREFAGSRLEEQVLIQAFELVVPALRQDLVENEFWRTEVDNPPVNPLRTQGA